MIEQASFKNFKNLRDVTVHFKTPLTVLVGPNASGKTSILEGLAFLCSLRPSKRRLPHLSPWEGPSQYGYSLSTTIRNRERDLFEVLFEYSSAFDNTVEITTQYKDQLYEKMGGAAEALEEIVGKHNKLKLAMLPSASLIRLEVSRLTAVSQATSTMSVIEPNGHGLAAALADMATGDPARFNALQDLVRTIVPAIRWVKVKRRPMASDDAMEMMAAETKPLSWGHKIFLDSLSAQDIPAELASEGTLLTLGILAFVEQTGTKYADRSLLLIDDLDRGLHPKAQRELVAALRKLLEQKPGLQIIATSHSPYLLDCLVPEEVCMTALAEDGSALCGALTEHPEFSRWKDVMLPGEFWSSVGEDWLRGLRSQKDG